MTSAFSFRQAAFANFFSRSRRSSVEINSGMKMTLTTTLSAS
jgi:hypothetical protein